MIGETYRTLSVLVIFRDQPDPRFAKSTAVISRGDFFDTGHNSGRFNRGLRCGADGGEVMTVNDDFHHGFDAIRNLRLDSRPAFECRAERMIRAGEQKLMLAAGLGPAGCDARAPV